MKPFNLEEAKAGKPVVLGDGRKARIVCYDRKNKYPLVVLVENEDGDELMESYTLEGTFYSHTLSIVCDLFMAAVKTIKYVNLYKNGNATWYDCEEDALDGGVGCATIASAVPVEIEE